MPPSTSADEPAQPAAESPAEPAAEPASGNDELRDKFREALERKHGRSVVGTGGAPAQGGSKAAGATENSKRQREFRRKSGG